MKENEQLDFLEIKKLTEQYCPAHILPIIYTDEYRDEDGVIRCKVCGGARSVKIGAATYRCLCECQEKDRVKKEIARKAEARLEAYKDLCKNSLMGERYKTVTFANTQTGNNESFDKAFARCRQYCECAKEVLDGGFGAYIYGGCGSGKTHLAACMANDLLQQLHPVVFTNFFEIQRDLKECFGTKGSEAALVARLTEVDFLFIDDIGTERMTTADGAELWVQDKMFDIINRRYNAKKPTVFTSNYGLKDLYKNRGVAKKTVDRIYEMTAGADMKVEGTNYRIIKNEQKLPF